MLSLGSLAFLSPWLLLALAGLPVLWWLLRATPPSPRRLAFPGVRLLLGLEDPEKTPHRTPWWLLLLRISVAAAAIFAFADPVLNPKARLQGEGPLLLVMDGGWASAPDWRARQTAALDILTQAERAERPAILRVLAQPSPEDGLLSPNPASELRGAVEALRPAPWAPRRGAFAEALEAVDAEDLDTVWLHDGLAHDAFDGAETGGLAETLADRGELRMIGPRALARALRPPRLADGALAVEALRPAGGAEEVLRIAALGPRPGEAGLRRLAVAEAVFDAEATLADAVFDLPLELRNQVTRVEILGADSAGSVGLADDALKRRRSGLVASGGEGEAQRLVSSLHYLRTGLAKISDVVEGDLLTLLDQNPDALFLADIGQFGDEEREQLEAWVREGGALIRFAGPHLARGEGEPGAARADFSAEDPLLPVQVRRGGRAVGGAMAWGAPQAIREFSATSPFAGLTAPRDVSVSRQVLAELTPDLAGRTWAALEDGTPLVTSAPLGEGRVILFHVTANADWSSLPISGLFVDMLERILALASGGSVGALEDRAEALFRPVALLDGAGRLAAAEGALVAGVTGARLLEGGPGPDAPPGLYSGEGVGVAYNVMRASSVLAPAAAPPGGVAVEALDVSGETPLAPWLLLAAILLLIADTCAALILSGRGPRLGRVRTIGLAAALAAPLALGGAPPAEAQQVGAGRDSAADEIARLATRETVLAYVRTGDPQVDALSEAGLRGLSRILTSRTAVLTEAPMGVDLEIDELAFFPVLYWPITESQPTPSDEAAGRLNAFMRTGGMIVFDTRDRHLAAGSGVGPRVADLRRLTRSLDLPALEPTPDDHVLTRTFYLLDDFPGRWRGGAVWIEASLAPEAAEEGAPFRNLNDGVSPVIVGSADWAAAWAVDHDGSWLAPVDGTSGFRQREMAYRFGVNLVMYALTGNYKSDQVHVPALLERLGQ